MVTIQCQQATFHDIHAVLFDKDGTLADSAAYLRQLAQRRSRLIDAQIPGVQDPLLMAFGVEAERLDPAGLMAVGTRYENEIAAAAYIAETGRGWRESLKIAQDCFRDADHSLPDKASQTPLFAGALDLLTDLHRAGLRLGIVSADSPEQVQSFVQFYQLGSLLPVQVGSTEAVAKPNPALVEQACAALNVLPRHTLIVGDAPSDIEMAIAAAAAGCIGVTWGGSNAQALSEADALIDAFSDMGAVG